MSYVCTSFVLYGFQLSGVCVFLDVVIDDVQRPTCGYKSGLRAHGFYFLNFHSVFADNLGRAAKLNLKKRVLNFLLILWDFRPELHYICLKANNALIPHYAEAKV
jgi:hypothetical protein